GPLCRDVRIGCKRDVAAFLSVVRSTPTNGHRAAQSARLKSATFGLMYCGEKRLLDHLVRIGYLDEAGTHAAAARPTVLPIRILQLCPAAHLPLSPDDAASSKLRLARAFGV